MNSVDRLRKIFLRSLESDFSEPEWNRQPDSLYAPQRYILGIGGKRLRPILALMAVESMGRNALEGLPVAHAVEKFHNFSLIHDDIMDEAPIRRGKATVHENWGINTGILSGDALLVMAYRSLLKAPKSITYDLLEIFNQTALEVCEGQQMDMDFESLDQIEEGQYLNMIRNKTAALIGCSLQMGSLIAGASKEVSKSLFNFGIELGISFQIHDDLLDAFGSVETFGKQIGGDIHSQKKTLLWTHFSNHRPDALKSILKSESKDKVQEILSAMESSGSRAYVEDQRKKHFDLAISSLHNIKNDNCDIKDLESLANWIFDREV
jgi:geranylgeranyl diphosphate synthase type II